MKNDYFSTQSAIYKKFRPTYPSELYGFLANTAPNPSLVWDCATGNGQAALGISPFVDRVIASDHSYLQLSQAPQKSNITYVRASAERTPIATETIDLVTVAQAIHWFDFERFYPEVKRVLRPGGRIAAWTYSFLATAPQLGKEIFAIVEWFYHDVVGPYWPPERRWVDEAYQSLPFPFAEINPPKFSITVQWTLAETLGYIASWSAVQLYQQATQSDPMPLLKQRLRTVWDNENEPRELRWQIAMRVGINP